jgi:hypothetical protein
MLKAKIKNTGEIIKVVNYNSGSELVELLFPTSNGDRILNSWDVVFLDEEEHKPIDWEQRRYEIAKDVLSSSFSTPMEGTSIISYVRSCVQIADMLVAELKGGEQ